VRTWPGLAAIGAGLIHLGSASGAPLAVLIPLSAVGAAEVLFGILALARDEPPAARIGAGALAAVLVLSVVALLLPGSAARHGSVVDLGVPAIAFAGAAVLDLVLGVLLALQASGLRRPAGGGPVRFLLAAALGAGVVAVITTQSLAATSVGGSMPMMH
jgi:hypothetical protein